MRMRPGFIAGLYVATGSRMARREKDEEDGSASDRAGHPYADNLYFGHRFYTGFYDRIGLSWERRLGRAFHLRIGARAHFTSTGYMGWQQTATLRFDLGAPLGR